MLKLIKPLYLKCGGKVSIQASEDHYCTPRNNTGPYTEWEIGFPEGVPEEAMAILEDFDGQIASHVPTLIVQAFVQACGGAEGMMLHPFGLVSKVQARRVPEEVRM